MVRRRIEDEVSPHWSTKPATLDDVRKAFGEEWKARDEDLSPYLLEFLSRARQTIYILTDNLQELFGNTEVVKKLEEKLRQGVVVEIIHSGQGPLPLTEAGRLGYWFSPSLRLFPLGERHPQIEFIIIDGLHTLHKEPDYLNMGISSPEVVIRLENQVWAGAWEKKFQEVKGLCV